MRILLIIIKEINKKKSVAKLSVIRQVGIAFASEYLLQPREGVLRAQYLGLRTLTLFSLSIYHSTTDVCGICYPVCGMVHLSLSGPVAYF